MAVKKKNDTYFRSLAPRIMRDLIKDIPSWGVLDAAAALGNGGHESNGFKTLQETKPVVAGSRGGYGFFQWTGPRRRAFEKWAEIQGYDLNSYEANYGFLLHELRTTEKGTVAKVKAAKGLEAKVIAFELAFERAGVKHYPSRLQWAQIALDEWESTGGKVPPPVKKPNPSVVGHKGIKLPRKIPGSKGDPVVYFVQHVLDEKGWHEVGTVDGAMGSRTQGAILMFRNEQEPTLEPLTPTIDQKLVDMIEASQPRKVSVVRATTTATDLAKKGDETILGTRDLIAGAGALGGVGTVGAVDQQGKLDTAKGWLDGFDTAQEVVTRGLDAVQWTLQHWWIPAIGAAVYFGVKAYHIRQKRVAEHRSGQNLAL